MTVFKTFLKVLNKYKWIVLMYSLILIFFGGFNISTNESSTNFTASKPDVLIINKDEEVGITKDLIKYIDKNCNIIDLEDSEDVINDALFYREVNYIIYIDENFREDFLNKKNPEIKIKSTGDYMSSLAEMKLDRYIGLANIYNDKNFSEEEIIKNVNETLSKETKIEMTTKLDTNNLEKASFYYNFANYSLLAGVIYVVCLILSSFKSEMINKRTIISSTNYKTINRKLLLSNGLFSVILWLFYVIMSFILVGDVMFSSHGLLYIINSFVFMISILALAFLIATLVNNKDAINGIVNVVGLGTSFLCGAFVPVQFLPESILTVAHILPSYYYINANEIIKTLEVINLESLKPVLIDMSIVVIFSIAFIVINNIISKKKQVIG